MVELHLFNLSSALACEPFLIPDLQLLSRKEGNGNGIDFACGKAPAAKVIWSGGRVCKRSPCETGCDLTARERGETQVKRLAWELCCRLITKMGTHPLGLQLSLYLQSVIGCQVQNTVPLLGTWAVFSLAQLCGLEDPLQRPAASSPRSWLLLLVSGWAVLWICLCPVSYLLDADPDADLPHHCRHPWQFE